MPPQEPLSETEYEQLASPELQALVDAIDALEDESFDAELEGDILRLEFEDGDEYVLNSHRAARQIWMAAQHSAWHFNYQGHGQWVTAKTQAELWSTLSQAITQKLGYTVTLVHSAKP